jgi:hypothetical protein
VSRLRLCAAVFLLLAVLFTPAQADAATTCEDLAVPVTVSLQVVGNDPHYAPNAPTYFAVVTSWLKTV